MIKEYSVNRKYCASIFLYRDTYTIELNRVEEIINFVKSTGVHSAASNCMD
ncbi:hypothetical protein DPMN_092710 [Dreissena polymorpha]|uniref:Uncharacterized protein n=1 Tax=Dreissena polymorpha TaxID=45954 RepID=A0A9D4L474_DREPO|nr:hypothetical protein DPMN_092710 [Dreissena polymorpha]